MKRFLPHILILLTAAVVLTSCFKDDESTSDYDGQSLITAATLGTLTRDIYYVNNNGRDTMVTRSVNGALYPLTIDQINHRIYNAELLPAHTHTDKVVLSALTAQGTVAIKDDEKDHDYAWEHTDSTDFTQPRTLTVYGLDGTSRTSYTMEVRVHQQLPDSMQWQSVSTTGLPADLLETRLLSRGDSILLWGTTAGEVWCYWTQRQNPTNWQGDRANNAPTPQSIIRHGGQFLGMTDTNVVSSADGKTWTNVGLRTGSISSLIGSTTRNIYGLNATSFLRSTDEAHHFLSDACDIPAAIPTQSISAVSYPTRSNHLVEEILLAGNTTDGQTVVWKRNDMLRADQEEVGNFQWTLVESDSTNKYRVPHRENINLATYDGATLMAATDDAHHLSLLMSYDNGRCWADTVVTAPAPLTQEAQEVHKLAMTVDADNYIWLLCNSTLWRGRINRLGWVEDKQVFLKTRKR